MGLGIKVGVNVGVAVATEEGVGTGFAAMSTTETTAVGATPLNTPLGAA